MSTYDDDENHPQLGLWCRSNEYFIEDEMVIIRPEAGFCIYRVHRYVLERDSKILRDMLSERDREDRPEGKSEESPFVLMSVTAYEFECLLDFLYRGMYPRSVSLDDWIALLSIASRYECGNIHYRAKKEIEKYGSRLLAVQRIRIGRTCQVPEWLKPAYVELCLRTELLTDEETRVVGLTTALGIMTAKVLVRDPSLSSLGSTDPNGAKETAVRAVERVFYRYIPRQYVDPRDWPSLEYL